MKSRKKIYYVCIYLYYLLMVRTIGWCKGVKKVIAIMLNTKNKIKMVQESYKQIIKFCGGMTLIGCSAEGSRWRLSRLPTSEGLKKFVNGLSWEKIFALMERLTKNKKKKKETKTKTKYILSFTSESSIIIDTQMYQRGAFVLLNESIVMSKIYLRARFFLFTVFFFLLNEFMGLTGYAYVYTNINENLCYRVYLFCFLIIFMSQFFIFD